MLGGFDTTRLRVRSRADRQLVSGQVILDKDPLRRSIAAHRGILVLDFEAVVFGDQIREPRDGSFSPRWGLCDDTSSFTLRRSSDLHLAHGGVPTVEHLRRLGASYRSIGGGIGANRGGAGDRAPRAFGASELIIAAPPLFRLNDAIVVELDS